MGRAVCLWAAGATGPPSCSAAGASRVVCLTSCGRRLAAGARRVVCLTSCSSRAVASPSRKRRTAGGAPALPSRKQHAAGGVRPRCQVASSAQLVACARDAKPQAVCNRLCADYGWMIAHSGAPCRLLSSESSLSGRKWPISKFQKAVRSLFRPHVGVSRGQRGDPAR